MVVSNPVAAEGGTPAETLSEASGRAVRLMSDPNRAVTLKDYEILAKRTPGTRIARTAARANLHPNFTCLKAPGVITVVVLPEMPVAQPTPSYGLKRAVDRYLNRRRIIGTRVEVVGPGYLEVAVEARVKAHPGVNREDLQQRIVNALNAFFDPFKGGPEGNGWPFGRDVYRSEILQVIDELEGVDYILSLNLIAEGCDPQCGNVCLPPTTLVTVGRHEIEVI
jgi:predicted phage baseplate assembly protein